MAQAPRRALVKVLEEAGLGDLSSLLEPAIAYIAAPIGQESSSWLFGDVAVLPTGSPWPTALGAPLAVVAHLDLAGAPDLPDWQNQPSDGRLVFFSHRSWFLSDRPGDGCGQVIYVPADADTELQTRPAHTPPAQDADLWLPWPRHEVIPILAWTFPGYDDHLIVELGEDLVRRYIETVVRAGTIAPRAFRAVVGGHAQFLLDWSAKAAALTSEDPRDWIDLASIIDDVGVDQFAIRRRDLEAMNFDEVFRGWGH